MLPEIDGCGLGLPDPAHCLCRAGWRARDIPSRRRHTGRSRPSRRACRRSDRARTPKPFLVPTTKVKKPSRSSRAAFQRLAEILAMRHLRGEIGGRDLGVVLGLECHAFADQLAAQIVVVGQRAVVHQALVGAGRERDARPSSSPPIPSPCGYGRCRACRSSCATSKRIDDRLGQADFLVDLDDVAGAHDADVGAQRLDAPRAPRRSWPARS